LLSDLPSWVTRFGIPIGATGLVLLLHAAVSAIVARVFYRRIKGTSFGEALIAARMPSRIAVILLVLLATLPLAEPGPQLEAVLSRSLGALLVIALGWTFIRMTNAAFNAVLHGRDYGTLDIETRGRVTLLTLCKRLALLGIALVTAGLVLTAIPVVRNVGLSLFASAGVAGIVVGLAAQPTITNLIAGIQLALTQPIRIGDQIILENEFGGISEITSTYVVVALWDDRRMIVPLSYFLQKPFQNWTHDQVGLVQPIMIYADYSAPVPAIRDELHQILSESRLWDRRVWNLQVTELKPDCVELRALVSAASAAQAWDLRCEVREKLLAFIRDHHKDALPGKRVRVAEDWAGQQPENSGRYRPGERTRN
jgi:small-conductance mechanosensitive channel